MLKNHNYLYQISHTQQKLLSVNSLLHVSAVIASYYKALYER